MNGMSRWFATSSLALSLVSLAACGGGGGDDGGSAPSAGTSPAEGAYAGTLTGGPSNGFQLVILEDGTYWSIYGTQVGSLLYVNGFVQGSGTAANGQFSSNNARDFGYAPSVAGSIVATYVPGVSISGTTYGPAGASGTFSGTRAGISPYVYEQPANLANITGSWRMQMLSGETTNVSINTNGSFTAVSSGGCQFSGTILPRASGKNVFNVSLTFGAAPCLLAGQRATGIGVYSSVSGGGSQLMVAVVDGARAYGAVGFANR